MLSCLSELSLKLSSFLSAQSKSVIEPGVKWNIVYFEASALLIEI